MGRASSGGSQLNNKRIVWVDDSRAEFDRVKSQWNVDREILSDAEGAHYELDYLSLEDLIDEDDSALDQLLKNPPEVLVLDWHEGDVQKPYKKLKGRVHLIILVSWSRQDDLRVGKVFKDYPELEYLTLTKPFSAQQLLALVQRAEQPRTAESPRLIQRLKKLVLDSGSAETSGSIDELLAIRYLNADLVPVAISGGWRIDLNRPELTWSDGEKVAVQTGQSVQHTLLSSYPADPEKFGPVQFITRLIPRDTMGSLPSSARYLQQGQALPETGIGIEAFGRSVDGIIDLMRQAGFARGRYYHLADVPGLASGPSLELIARYPDDANLLPLPASREIDESERTQFASFVSRLEKLSSVEGETQLLYEIRSVSPTDNDDNDHFWARYVDDKNITSRLDIPAFTTKSEQEKVPSRENSTFRQIRGIFVFDRGNAEPMDERHVRAVMRPLLSALRYFSEARLVERARFEQARALRLLNFHEHLAKLGDGQSIENELIQMATQMVGLDSRGGVSEISPGVRSALYVRFDSVQQTLEVSCGTDDVMNGFVFSLEQERFVLVRCAVKALKSGPEEIPLPLFEPDYDALPEDKKIRKEDWLTVPQCTPEKLLQCEAWLRDTVMAVVAFPIMSGGDLLGVLVLRSNRSHEFTRRRVQGVSRAIDVALPYLERLRNEANRKIWDGLVMHEMRGKLSWAKSKADVIENAECVSDRKRAVNELMFVLEDGISLSSLFLRWLGFPGRGHVISTDQEFWDRLNQYGNFRSSSSVRLKWVWNNHRTCHGTNAHRLDRAVRVLIDNAFQYADATGDKISCMVEASDDEEHLVVCVANPGRLQVRRALQAGSSQDPSLENLPRELKAEIGLTLVRMLCREVGGRLELLCDESIPNAPVVIARLLWPIARES